MKSKRPSNRNDSDTPRKPDPEPPMEWQVGDYERQAQYNFTLPYEVLLLCKIFDITPRDLIGDFLHSLSGGSWKRKGRSPQFDKAMEYFMACGYGDAQYTAESKAEIFRDLNAVGSLWPQDASAELIDLHTEWRDRYLEYWFNKWYDKPRKRI